MKLCNLCGSTFDDRVDFCFRDGTVLSLQSTDSALAGASVAAVSGVSVSSLSAPDPRSWALSAPDPGQAAMPAAPAAPAAPIPRQATAIQVEEDTSGDVTVPILPPMDSPSLVDVLDTPKGVPDDLRSLIPGLEEEQEEEFDFGDGGEYQVDEFDLEPEPEILPPPRKSASSGLPVVLMAAAVFVAIGGGLFLKNTLGNKDPSVAAVTPELVAQVVEPPAPRAPDPPPMLPPVQPDEPEELLAEVESEEAPEEIEAAMVETREEVRPPPEGRRNVVVEQPRPRRTVETRDSDPRREPPPANDEAGSGTQVVDDSPNTGGGNPWGTTQGAVEGRVHIRSQPEGAVVEVDGMARGRTPLSVTLPFGTHRIQVSMDGYTSADHSIDVQSAEFNLPVQLAASEIEVPVNFFGPPGARVYLGDQLLGTLPLSLTVLEGLHTFKIVQVSGDPPFYVVRRLIKADPSGGSVPISLITD